MAIENIPQDLPGLEDKTRSEIQRLFKYMFELAEALDSSIRQINVLSGRDVVSALDVEDILNSHGLGQTVPNPDPNSLLIGNRVKISFGSGVPNGMKVGSPPDIYLDINGGANLTIWIKESGVATNSGWAAK